MFRMLKRLWHDYKSPVTAEQVSQEHREIKHKIRGTEAKIDYVLHNLFKDMRGDRDKWQDKNGFHP
jgi:hypothetical protein